MNYYNLCKLYYKWYNHTGLSLGNFNEYANITWEDFGVFNRFLSQKYKRGTFVACCELYILEYKNYIKEKINNFKD